IRGIDSIANAVALAAASARVVCGLVSGARKPIRIDPAPSSAISASLGGEIFTTTSARQTSAESAVICAPASTNAPSGSSAAAPAPLSTRTSMPLPFNLATTSGTSATLCSPTAVSFGTPTRMKAGKVSDLADGRQPERPVCQTRGVVTVNLTRIYTKLGDAG